MGSPYSYQSGAGGGTSTGSAFDSSLELTNLGLATSVAANALTISLKGKNGSDPSATNIVNIAFRDGTATVGTYTQRTVTSALSVVVSSGSTLGTTNATAAYLYVYAIDNGGTVELGVSTGLFDEGSLQTSVAEGGAGAADSFGVLYSTTARTTKPIRLIGRILITEATAGTWASAATSVSPFPFVTHPGPTVQVLTSGTAATYTTPANARWLRVRMVGGGGGGSSTQAGGNGGNGGTGGSTTFGSSLLTATGGGGGGSAGAGGGVGSTGTISSPAIALANIVGGGGGPSALTAVGGASSVCPGLGGNSAFGGGGPGSYGGGVASAGQNGGANTGGGGSGSAISLASAVISGAGGSAGNYIEAIILSPLTSYTYTIGAGGTAGTAGTSGAAGGVGGTGVVIVEEYY